jgi:hypothetical protein
MTDTALWVPQEKLDRVPAAYRHGEAGLVETERARASSLRCASGAKPQTLVCALEDVHRVLRCAR